MTTVDNCNAKVIRAIRKFLGLTQQELAEVLGRRREQISRWENGVAEATFEMQDILALDGLLRPLGKRFTDFED